MPDGTQRILNGLIIRQLAEQYARAVDALDLRLFEECFAEEVYADYSEVGGVPPVSMRRHTYAEGLLRRMSGFDTTQHLIANVAVDFNDADDHAVCEATSMQHMSWTTSSG